MSPPGETLKVKPVKLGRGPGRKSELMPSQAPEFRGRCREQTAGTYGRKTTVKACSRLRTSHRATAAKAAVGRKSTTLKSVSVRLRPRHHSTVAYRVRGWLDSRIGPYAATLWSASYWPRRWLARARPVLRADFRKSKQRLLAQAIESDCEAPDPTRRSLRQSAPS